MPISKVHTHPSPGAIAEVLECDFTTGVLTWRARRTGGKAAGTVAGSPHKDGYIGVKALGRYLMAHRIVWCLAHGSWPFDVIDHIDGNKTNNAISNLRAVSQTQNLLNQKKKRTSALSMKGVDRLPGGRFRGRVCNKTVGIFDTAAEAEQACARRRAELLECQP